VWLALVLALVVVAGGVLLVRSISSGGDDPSTTSADASTSSSPDSDSGTPSSQPTEDSTSRAAGSDGKLVRACAAELSTADGVVAAADRGVADWNDHVQARTDMLEGRMSVERMDAIWARTRIAGPGDQEKFHAAMEKHGDMSDCHELKASADGADDPAADCVSRATAAERTVAAAEAAMRDWESHLTNMAAYAHGDMTSDMAQDKWVAAWRDAPAHIKAYDDARAELAAAPSCDATRG
jgi:hypothetical protein